MSDTKHSSVHELGRTFVGGRPALMTVVLNVNGAEHTLELDPRVTLLDALREHLHLTGAKRGCDHGQCGACTVHIGGMRINSCLTLAVMHQGQTITTIEGLAQNGALHPVQAAFIEHDGAYSNIFAAVRNARTTKE